MLTRDQAAEGEKHDIHRFSQIGTDEEKTTGPRETRRRGARIGSRLSSPQSACPGFALPSV